jgi:hypothetical protein
LNSASAACAVMTASFCLLHCRSLRTTNTMRSLQAVEGVCGCVGGCCVCVGGGRGAGVCVCGRGGGRVMWVYEVTRAACACAVCVCQGQGPWKEGERQLEEEAFARCGMFALPAWHCSALPVVEAHASSYCKATAEHAAPHAPTPQTARTLRHQRRCSLRCLAC